MGGSASIGGFRRDGDGSPDIAFYRRRAARLRRAARVTLWRSVRRRTARAVVRPLWAALALVGRADGTVPASPAPRMKEV